MGFLVLLLATQIQSRRGFLIADLLGLGPVVAHYVLLDAVAGAAMSALYIAIDVTAAFDERWPLVKRLFPVHYLLAALVATLTFTGMPDLLVLLATWTAIASRQQRGMRRLLPLLVASSLGWGLYGVFVGSVGQMAFSTAYALAGSVGLWRIVRRTHA